MELVAISSDAKSTHKILISDDIHLSKATLYSTLLYYYGTAYFDGFALSQSSLQYHPVKPLRVQTLLDSSIINKTDSLKYLSHKPHNYLCHLRDVRLVKLCSSFHKATLCFSQRKFHLECHIAISNNNYRFS